VGVGDWRRTHLLISGLAAFFFFSFLLYSRRCFFFSSSSFETSHIWRDSNVVGRRCLSSFLALLFWIPNTDRILFAYCAVALLGVSLLAYWSGDHVLLMHRKHGVPGGCLFRSYTIIAAQLVARIEHVTVNGENREIILSWKMPNARSGPLQGLLTGAEMIK
jgi:hypothetical protein